MSIRRPLSSLRQSEGITTSSVSRAEASWSIETAHGPEDKFTKVNQPAIHMWLLQIWALLDKSHLPFRGRHHLIWLTGSVETLKQAEEADLPAPEDVAMV